jgi:hypothetical protein
VSMNRRAFIQGATVVAATPAVTALVILSSTKKRSEVESASSTDRNSNAAKLVVFKVDGWHSNTVDSSENEVTIRIDQSWRAAWR